MPDFDTSDIAAMLAQAYPGGRDPAIDPTGLDLAAPAPKEPAPARHFMEAYQRPGSVTLPAEKGAAEGLYGIARTPYDFGKYTAEAGEHAYHGNPGAAAIDAALAALAVPGKLPIRMSRAPVGVTIPKPYRITEPGIYGNPKKIAEEAAERTIEESPALKQVFGVTRGDLDDINLGGTREGNIDPESYLAFGPRPRGSDAAAAVTNPKNAQRLIDINAEAAKYPVLRDMRNWYVMDPLYQRLEKLLGPEEATKQFWHLQTMMGMFSPGSGVRQEIPRGLAATYLDDLGRFKDFAKYGNETKRLEKRTGVTGVPGHIYHSTSQVPPVAAYLTQRAAGEAEFPELLKVMGSPKVPNYIAASGAPTPGFQTTHAPPDTHFATGIGFNDAKPGEMTGVKMAPMRDIWPWWRDDVATPLGLEAVPAQAQTWGALSPQTGVKTGIGPSKLEMLADHIVKRAYEEGVSPGKMRDLILMGKSWADGGKVPQMLERHYG